MTTTGDIRARNRWIALAQFRTWFVYASRLTDDYFRILPGEIQSKKEVLNDFRVSNAKTISMVHEQMDVRIYGNTTIMTIQLRSREQTPDGHAIEHLGRATLGDSFPRWSYRLWRTSMITTVCMTLAWS